MLRIMIYDRPKETRFLVEGRLVGRWVKALEKCWEIGLAAEQTKATLVNLAVTSVDWEGRELLTRMRRHGVRLESAGARRMNEFISEIEEEVEVEKLPWV